MTKEERCNRQKEKLIAMSRYENELRARGVSLIAGVDEVGRGPLAGPVVTAAVILPADFDVLGVDDSKKLSEKRREELFDRIRERAVCYAIGMRSPQDIDRINILEATKEAMADAVMHLAVTPEHILFDQVTGRKKGDPLDLLLIPATFLTKGDAASVSIAAASILAKVTRDRMMAEYDQTYPGYGFASNKGYGTAEHYEGLERNGLTPIHRRSFITNWEDHFRGR